MRDARHCETEGEGLRQEWRSLFSSNRRDSCGYGMMRWVVLHPPKSRLDSFDIRNILLGMKTSTAKTDFLTAPEVADRLGRTPQYIGMVARELGLGTLINPRLRIFSHSEFRAIRAKIKSVSRKPVEPC